MKKINALFGILVFASILILAGVLYAADVSETASYHLKMADSYEQKAKEHLHKAKIISKWIEKKIKLYALLLKL